MKKSAVIYMTFMLSAVVCFCSCSTNETADTSLELSSGYESIGNIEFKVSDSWEKLTDGRDYKEYGISQTKEKNSESMWIMFSDESEGETFEKTVEDMWGSLDGIGEKNKNFHDIKREKVEINDMTGGLMSYVEETEKQSKINKTLVLETGESTFITLAIYVPKEKEEICDEIINSISKNT